MTTKKVVHNTDAKMVASKQKHELDYICSTWQYGSGDVHVPLYKHELKEIMQNLGSKKNPCRSRRMIYIALRGMGYTRVPSKKSK